MAGRIIGLWRNWKGGRDSEGYRTWNMTFLVQVEFAMDGPSVAVSTPGLPLPGSMYAFGNDLDIWSYCKLDFDVSPQFEKGGNYYYLITYTYTNKSDVKSCKDQQIDNPLLEPMKVNGGTKNMTAEATFDYLGRPVTNSSLEPIRGPQNEWDDGRDTITIEQNVAVLDLAFCNSLRNKLNAYPMWGLPPRCIKLSDFTWDQKFYGQCFPYFTRKFTFDAKADGFDRNVLDEGTKVLKGHWDNTTGDWTLENIGGSPPSRTNPGHFIRYKDKKGENSRTLLDAGKPWLPPELITSCSACPTGTYNKLQVLGLGFPLLMRYDSNCTWRADPVDPQNPTLEYNIGPPDTWTFSLDTVPGVFQGGTWSIAGSSWNCTGANILVKTSGAYPAPTVILAPQQAPTISIQKYGTADFLLLGIPAILGP